MAQPIDLFTNFMHTILTTVVQNNLKACPRFIRCSNNYCMQSGFHEMTHFQAPREETSINLPNISVNRGAFHQAFCQCFSLTTVISYWNPCIWLAESKFVSEKHWQNAWWNAPPPPGLLIAQSYLINTVLIHLSSLILTLELYYRNG